MRRARLISLFLSAVPTALHAQWQVTGDVGLARLNQTGLRESTAQTFGATLGKFSEHLWIRSSFLAAHASMERWTGQAIVAGSWLSPRAAPVQLEISGTATTFAETNANTARSAELMSLLHADRPLYGAAVGIGGGARQADAGGESVLRGQASVWGLANRNRFSGDVSLIRTTTALTSFNRGSSVLWYSDISGSWRRALAAFSVGGTVGYRASESPLISTGGWAMLDGSVWLGPRVAAVAALGRLPQDVVRGVPSIRYASIALRFASRPRPSLAVARTIPKGIHLDATRDRIELHAASATRVEIMADFTDWKPVALERSSDGVWRLSKSLAPGLHRLTIRIDGGDWTTPPNLPTSTDDLGGVVALITVP
jgi:hypothetical protein